MFAWFVRHPFITIALAFFVAFPALGWSFVRTYRPGWWAGGPRPAKAYYYDLDTDRLFVAEGEFAPVMRVNESSEPAGESGVRAVVMSCTDCEDESRRRVAYLETVGAEGKRALLSRGITPDSPTERIDAVLLEEGLTRWVSAPVPGVNWVEAGSAEGRAIVARGEAGCPDGTTPVACVPR